jgi:exodeoxyribonuclease V alpha subunit
VSDVVKGKVGDFFARKDDGWCAIDVDCPSGLCVRVTGVFPLDLAVGDTVEVAGIYVTSKWGKQLKASHLLLRMPGTSAVIEGWLVNNLPNVGPVRAADIVRRFGEDLWDVIETTPARLREVSGITAERVGEITAAYASVRAQRDLVLELGNAGIDYRIAGQVVSEYGARALEALQAEPYEVLLSRRVPFEQVDAIARGKFKVSPQDPRRIRAFVRKELMDRTYRDGHCYTMIFEIATAAAQTLKIKGADVEAVLADYPSVVLHGKRVMLLEIDEAENVVATRMRELLER